MTIRGLLLVESAGGAHAFPEDELRELLRWERLADSVEVSGELFELLGIKRVCIEKINLGRIANMPNLLPFQLQCCSDESLEIALQFPR